MCAISELLRFKPQSEMFYESMGNVSSGNHDLNERTGVEKEKVLKC